MYEIIYDYDNEYDTERNIMETFTGDWFELQDYIKQMKANGCYNISASAVGDW
ncbi:MAG: hypothetical protein J6N19_17735 [Clostridium sp.]|nr:hypothetical protein [Clostridium sp.]